MCVIHSQWCLNSDVSTKKVVISIEFGTKRQTEVAKVSVKLFVHEFSCKAALIDGEETDQLLLGTSIGTDLLWDLLKARHETSYRVCETRVQSKKRQEDELRCKHLDEQDGATPHLDAPIVESYQDAEMTEADDPTPLYLRTMRMTLPYLRQLHWARMRIFHFQLWTPISVRN